MKDKKARFTYLEEYQGCGCIGEFRGRRAVLGYCGTHGGSRKRLTRLNSKEWDKAAKKVAESEVEK